MAGLDKKRQSDFILMLQEVGRSAKPGDTAEIDPVVLCTETVRTLKMVSESLLLRERDTPLSKQNFSGCADTMVAKTKATSICVNNLDNAIRLVNSQKICLHLGQLAEAVSIIVETTAQAVYMVAENNPNCKKAKPSVIDNYPLARGQLAIEVALDALRRPSATSSQAVAISAVIATHLEALRDQCSKASQAVEATNLQQQFKACARGLGGITSMLVIAIKGFVLDPTEGNRQKCGLFGKPLLETVDALMQFSQSDESFSGTPPKMTREVAEYVKPIQGAALSLVSATCLYVGAVKSMLTAPHDTTAQANLAKYANSIDDALAAVVDAVKSAKKAKIVYEV